ncbi:F0F1 ATP synthase subunit A [Radicibacter daui]|uniref:F0F1 ATP synthase subunit A n=1 Tax=Radicibacter daui TaxID=3064829 RepID=UPI004046E999
MAGPIEQFEIVPLVKLPLGLDYTNSALWMTLAVVGSFAVMLLGMRGAKTVPGRFQSVSELLYEFIAGMVRDHAGHKATPYFPFVFSVFIFVLFGNALGMIPWAFTFTSHIIVTFTLAAMVFIFVTLLGIYKHGLHFFSLFLPEGAPLALAPIIVPIEIISYLSRPVSLSIRLFANMMAGHTMMKVFAGFSVSLGAALGVAGYTVGILPIIINVGLVGFEFLVAFLQAYVFTILTCLYIRDALELH